jgi:hypothetical protein
MQRCRALWSPGASPKTVTVGSCWVTKRTNSLVSVLSSPPASLGEFHARCVVRQRRMQKEGAECKWARSNSGRSRRSVDAVGGLIVLEGSESVCHSGSGSAPRGCRSDRFNVSQPRCLFKPPSRDLGLASMRGNAVEMVLRFWKRTSILKTDRSLSVESGRRS